MKNMVLVFGLMNVFVVVCFDIKVKFGVLFVFDCI